MPSEGAFTPKFTAGLDDEHWPILKQRAWMAERFLSRPPKVNPGTHKQVFAPLGMSGCGFGPTATARQPDGNWGHDVKDGA